MKNLKYIMAFLGLAILASSFIYLPTDSEPLEKKVKWYTWEEAVEANKKVPKKIMVDVYTNWCHWCKVMDKKTFEKDQIANYLNEHFYPVKLNAEQKGDIVFNDHTFKFVKGGRRGVHTLAHSLLDGQLSYPSIVFLNEKFERAMVSAGFKKPDEFLTELEYIVGEHYRTTHINQYKQQKK